MSFSRQKDVRYLVNQFHYWLLIGCMNTPAMLKRQRFKDSESDKTEPKRLKRECLDERDNKKGNSLDKDKGEMEDARYVPSPFILLLPLPQKVSNRLSDLDKGIKSQNYLVCIPKICYLRSTNFALEFLGRGSLKV